LANLAPITDVSYDIYFNTLHELTTDINRVKQYKDRPSTSRNQVSQFSKILKFDWNKYMDIVFPLTLSRETKSREVKILGFLNTGKILLQDQKLLEWPIIATPDEIIKVLMSLNPEGK
jgi:hypothetical protein